MFREIMTKRVLIFGCGNVLLGDDGFGPAVIKKLQQQYRLPDDTHAEDVGTSIRDILFNITLLEKRPEHLIILDAVDKPSRHPGEVFEINIDEIQNEKVVDYSLHQAPTSNLLKQIKDQSGIKITIIGAQVGGKLEEVKPGLSDVVRVAVREAAERVIQIVSDPNL